MDNFYYGILNSFQGAIGRLVRHDRPEAALWLLVDHILLTLQQPVYITIGLRCGGAYVPWYSSLSSQDRAFLGLVDMAGESFGEEVRRDRWVVRDTRERFAVGIRLLPREEGSGALNTNHRARGAIGKLIDDNDGIVLDALHAYDSSAGEVKAEVNDNGELVKALAQGDIYLRSLRDNLGRVIDTLGRNKLTESKRGDGLNLFAVFRRPAIARVVMPPSGSWDRQRVGARYTYSASLCLSQMQRDWLERHSIVAARLEEPLGAGFRSIADTPLSQGNIDFSVPDERRSRLWSRQYYGDDGGGEERESYEDTLYKLAFDEAEPPGTETIFYVPIHVQGIPWLALFTFNRGLDRRASMTRNYLIYRDLVPLLSESLSLAVQETFAEAVATAATDAFQDQRGLAGFVDAANRELKVLSAHYPYPHIHLSISGDESERLNIHATDLDYSIYLHVDKRIPQLPYRLLDLSFLRSRLEQRLQSALDHLQGQYRESLFVFGHHAGRLFQESGLPGLKTAGNPTLAAMKSRLFSAWGMSAAIRPLKQPGKGLPRDWFPKEFSGKSWRAPKRQIERRVRDICRFYLAGVSADLEPSWTVIWESEGKSSEESFRRVGKAVEKPLGWIPPLSGGVPVEVGTLAVTLGLAEIIRNARNHLSLSATDFKIGIRQREISRRVAVIRIVADECVCTVSVSSVHTRDANLFSNTVEQIQKIERTALLVGGQAVVSTSQARKGEIITRSFEWATATWEYRFGLIKGME